MHAPMNIIEADNSPVKRMPHLSRMMPATMRKPNTLTMYSLAAYVPNTSGVQPYWFSTSDCKGDIMSTNM